MVSGSRLRAIYRTIYLVGSQKAPNVCKYSNANVDKEATFLAEREIKREKQTQTEQIVSLIAEKTSC